MSKIMNIEKEIFREEADRWDAEEYLNGLDIWNHPSITDRNDIKSFEVAGIMADFANEYYKLKVQNGKGKKMEDYLNDKGQLVCGKCKSPTLLMTGYAVLEADKEPYESGKEEEPKEIKYKEIYIIAHYCEKCERFLEIAED